MKTPKYSVFTNMCGCMADDGPSECGSLAEARRVASEIIAYWRDDDYAKYDRWEALYSLRANMFTPTMPITAGVLMRNGVEHDLGFALNIVRNW